MEKAIENYKELHVFFQHWDKLPKFKVKNISSEIFGSKDSSNIYDILRISAIECLRYAEWFTFPHVPFESALPLPTQSDLLKDRFIMAFLRNLQSLNIEIKPIPEIYEYISQIFKNRERDFEIMKEFIEKLK